MGFAHKIIFMLKVFYQIFFQELEQVFDTLQKAFRDELQAQGHVNTGKLYDSIDYDIQILSQQIVSGFYFEDYGFIVDQGVKAERIPFNPGSGATSSKYIQGLINFFKSKGILNDKEAKSAAFATAWKHKREGMPTRTSFAYSNNGRRTGFVNRVLADESDKIFKLTELAASNSIETLFNQIIDRISMQLRA